MESDRPSTGTRLLSSAKNRYHPDQVQHSSGEPRSKGADDSITDTGVGDLGSSLRRGRACGSTKVGRVGCWVPTGSNELQEQMTREPEAEAR